MLYSLFRNIHVTLHFYLESLICAYMLCNEDTPKHTLIFMSLLTECVAKMPLTLFDKKLQDRSYKNTETRVVIKYAVTCSVYCKTERQGQVIQFLYNSSVQVMLNVLDYPSHLLIIDFRAEYFHQSLPVFEPRRTKV